jgi:hypothetical protein
MDDMRNMLLTELIDKMHSRMADKMFPPDPSLDDQPAVTGLNQEGHTEDGYTIPAETSPAVAMEKSIDVDHDSEEPTDEELDELLG